ncbi:DNA alkylation repair protein [Nanoarchaeota archaeon]
MINELIQDMKKEKNSKKAKLLSGFFKTGKGQYGEGDVFWGLMVPQQRKIAKKYSNLELKDIQNLLLSDVHEQRLIGLFIMIDQFKKGGRERIFNLYLKNIRRVNNWDLVDLSAPNIVGCYLENKDRSLLYKLSRSNNLWEKRISIIATAYFIRNNDFKDALKISEILLKDKHDLIHKAVGWMLREVGKKDKKVETRFLDKYHKVMPRTMLRYSIERFDEKERKHYMSK